MKIRDILYGVVLLVAASACENDDYVWGEEDFVRINGPEIWTDGTDSMRFTFSTLPTDSMEVTMESTLTVQGRTADYNRSIHLRVDKEATTAPAGVYSFPEEVTLKAGEHSVAFPVVLRRTTEMQQKDVRLCIEIAPTGDLTTGVNDASSLTIVWNDKISKPANWDDKLVEFFGTYSEVKYRFIISTLGVYLFPYLEEEEFTWGLMYNYRLRMVAALEAYNNDPTNPDRPMKDENGGPVSFPN